MILAKENPLSSQWGSTYLVRSMTGGGAFSNVDQLLDLWEERFDGQKNHDDVNNTTLNGLVVDLLGTDRCIILQANNMGAWMSIHDTTVSGTVLLDTKFCDFLCKSYNVTPFNSQSQCDGCDTAFEVCHKLICIK